VIVSYKNNFIFLKTRKTAGTSIELMLSRFCGESDILTPLGLPDELVRMKMPGGMARNFAFGNPIERAFVDAAIGKKYKDFRTCIKELERSNFLFNHVGLARAVKLLDPAFVAGAFKFVVERHPYERVFSDAQFRLHMDQKNGEPVLALEDYIERSISSPNLNSRPLYCIDGKQAVNRVIRYENLADELPEVLGKLGITMPEAMPRANSGSRTDKRPARESLTDDQKERIYKRCKKIFDELGYEK